MKNYTTTIASEKSISEIQKMLARSGAREVLLSYDNDGLPVALSFIIHMQGRPVPFRLPSNATGVLKAMERNKKVPRSKCTPEQAQRVAWRVLKDWVAAQLAIIDAELAGLAQVFLPYAVTDNGQTMWERVEQGNMGLLGEGN